MITFSIMAMSVIVFLSRYVFLEPRLPLTLNPTVLRLLKYASPAVLTSIWAPIVFSHNNTLTLSFTNPYIWAACLTAFLMWKTHNVLLSIIIGMTGFLLLNLWLFA